MDAIIAIAETIKHAYKHAHDADPLSAFGSIVGLNRPVDKETAESLSKTFVEVIVAPSFDDKAFEILSKKASVRLIEMDMSKKASQKVSIKDVHGAFVVQTLDNKVVSKNMFNVITKKQPTAKQLNDLEFAFSVVKFVKSNAIVLVKNGRTIGIGAGQMSRVDAVEIALKKAGAKAKGAVLASDAFFPFKDSVELANKYGVAAIIQPGGSKRDSESIDLCNEKEISMVFTGSRHFKH